MKPYESETERRAILKKEDSRYFDLYITYKCNNKNTIKEKIDFIKQTFVEAEQYAEKKIINKICM